MTNTATMQQKYAAKPQQTDRRFVGFCNFPSFILLIRLADRAGYQSKINPSYKETNPRKNKYYKQARK